MACRFAVLSYPLLGAVKQKAYFGDELRHAAGRPVGGLADKRDESAYLVSPCRTPSGKTTQPFDFSLDLSTHRLESARDNAATVQLGKDVLGIIEALLRVRFNLDALVIQFIVGPISLIA